MRSIAALDATIKAAYTDIVSVNPCLCDSLRQATRSVTRMYDDALRPAGIRITQYTVLAYLAGKGESRVRDLGAGLLIEETTLTRSLKLLEDSGWIRIRQGEDRRERHVSITASGRTLLVRAKPLWERVQATVRERLSQPVWADLFRVLPHVADATSE